MSKEDSKYGFKDAQRAEESLKLLESEEVQYQKLTVRGLLGRAKRTLTSNVLLFCKLEDHPYLESSRIFFQ